MAVELDKVIRMLVSGVSEEAVRHACVEKFGLDHAEAAELVVKGRQQITLAADYHRDEELGTGIARLRDLYSRSVGAGDVKTALAAQKELNRLLKLYDAPHQPSGDAEAAEVRADHQAALDHLTPLGLAGLDVPLAEHARLAVAKILELQEHAGGEASQSD